MARLRVFLFGKLSVHRTDRTISGLAGAKVQELFCYLLLHRDRSHPRESLASLLWGDNSTAQSKKYLRQALWQLQAALHSEVGFVNSRAFLVEPTCVRLNSETGLWLDVAEFENAFAHVRDVPSHELDAMQVRLLQGATELYQGDLLEGWYQDWCLHERERLRNAYLTMLDKLMDYRMARCDYENAATYGARILRYDRAHECTHQRLMRLQFLRGDRAAALRQYQRCVTALDEELGVQPTEATVALYQDIRLGRLGCGPLTQAGVPAAAGPLADILGRLQRLETALGDVERQVRENTDAVRQLLSSQRQSPHRASKAKQVTTIRRAGGT